MYVPVGGQHAGGAGGGLLGHGVGDGQAQGLGQVDGLRGQAGVVGRGVQQVTLPLLALPACSCASGGTIQVDADYYCPCHGEA